MLRGYYTSMRDDATKANSIESDESRRYKEARLRVEDAIGSCLLPSLQLIPANPAIGYEIWDVLSLLPYEVVPLSSLHHHRPPTQPHNEKYHAYHHKTWKGCT